MKITHPGDRQPYRKEIVVILAAFLLSRVLSSLFGIYLQYDALYKYWQYLDTTTLRHDLLRGLWYDHAQPPFFNLLLGLVLKISGDFAPMVFALLLKCISLINCFLLLAILRRLIAHSYLPLLITLVYLLSPGLIIFESELFYTTFNSMLLLIAGRSILRLQERHGGSPGVPGHREADAPLRGLRWINAAGIFLPLTILCLTRSMYHIVWLGAVSLCLLVVFKKSTVFKPLLAGSFVSLLLVGGWYLKNYMIFGQFSTSSWLGMNLARTVFHDHPTGDSTNIATIEPFSDLRYYHGFIDTGRRAAFVGLDDRDLLWEHKNGSDSQMNLNHVYYLDISQQYMTASKAYMKEHPGNYLKVVLQSSIMFFAPATRYTYSEQPAKKIKYYDLIYSFNLSQFTDSKGPRRIALVLSALPKIFIYLCVFYLLGKDILRRKKISPLNLFIVCTISYVFLTSSLVEHYENMRFRYEIEPLFLMLLGQALLLAKPFKTIFNKSSALNQVLKS